MASRPRPKGAGFDQVEHVGERNSETRSGEFNKYFLKHKVLEINALLEETPTLNCYRTKLTKTKLTLKRH